MFSALELWVTDFFLTIFHATEEVFESGIKVSEPSINGTFCYFISPGKLSPPDGIKLLL
jgi:hypothetical protein